MADRSVVVRLLANVRGFVNGVERARAESDRMARELAEHAEKNAEAYEKVGKALTGIGIAAGAAVTTSVVKFAQFDKQMSAVQAATLASAEEMKGLRDAAIEAGQDTAYSAQEAAGGIEQLAKAGVSTADIMGGGLSGALSLAAAGELAVADAAEIAASTMVQFNLEGNEVERVADALAAGANKAQGSVQDLGLALEYAGVPAAAMNMTVEETTGVLGLFANAGITGEKAGTALRAMLVSLQNPSMKASETMADLGIEVFDAQGNFIGMEATAGVLQERMVGLTDEQRGAALATIFGNESLGAATTLYNGGASAVATWTEAVSESGYAAEVASTRLDNLAGDVTILRGSIDTAFIGLGEASSSPLREVTQDVTTLVNMFSGMPQGVQGGVLAVGAVTTAVGLAGGALFLMIPQALAANTALAAMGPAGAKAAAGIGAVSRALVFLSGPIAVLATGAFIGGKYWLDNKQAIDAYADSLDEAGTAVSDLTRDLVFQDLQQSGAIESAKELGLGLDVVTEAAMGNTDAIAEVDAVLAEHNAKVGEGTGLYGAWQAFGRATTFTMDEQAEAADNLARQVGINNDRMVDAAEVARDKAAADREGASSTGEYFRSVTQLGEGVETTGILAAEAVDPTDALAASVEGVGEEAMSAEEQLDAMSAALDALLGAELGVQEATDATEQALADLIERVEDAEGNVITLSGGITENTQAARDNRAAINDTMETITAEAEARIRSGEDIGTVTARIYESRDALIEEAIERGASREEAEQYTDVLLDIPATVTSNIETPGMTRAKEEAQELADILKNMPKNLKISTEVFTSEAKRDLATARRGAEMGDVNGSFRGYALGGGGGRALNRVRDSLPPGLRITSTYRSPAHNRRVGGSPTSKHMDKANPAVDIGGPTHLLDAYAQRLAGMGGWRQLLWRVKGHFDHIHVADKGGIFQGPGLVYMGKGQETFASGLQPAKKVADLPANYGRPAMFSGSGSGGGAGAAVVHNWTLPVDAAAIHGDLAAQIRGAKREADAQFTRSLEGVGA